MNNIKGHEFDELCAVPAEIIDPTLKDKARAELERRCSEVGLKFEQFHEDEFPDWLVIHMKDGRDTRPVSLSDIDELRSLLDVNFENYTFLGGYAAICSYANSYIEAALTPLAPASYLLIMRRLGLINTEQWASDAKATSAVVLANAGGGYLEIGAPSADFAAILNHLRVRITLKIRGIPVSEHDKAVGLLERVADSMLFQVDKAVNVALTLSRDRPNRIKIGHKSGECQPDLQFPHNQYDRSPMSLYWYARSAVRMPLLQFLAYYQALEFYFPAYSRAEAIRQLRNMLKDPNFRYSRDSDLARILSTIRATGGHAFGDERSQLKATLRECLDAMSLRSFLTDSEDRRKHFASKKKITEHVISLKESDSELVDKVGERIYDLRCKIVHTKSVDEQSAEAAILPFSKEAEQLYHDIDLLQFVCRCVLIAASSPLLL